MPSGLKPHQHQYQPPRKWVFAYVSREEKNLEDIRKRTGELAKDNPIYKVDSLASEVATGARKVLTSICSHVSAPRNYVV
ncbi:hypothetical protein VTN00DRAFT_2979 [Thermoascus crustaceus]|uniref:uncharacterized protein n=1 Tax=Thermoascus crustaceus TaxID=5088 RepID=UPI0037425310